MPHSSTELRMDSPRFLAMCEAVLAAGSRVRFQVRGLSMQPNVLDGDEVTVAPASVSALEKGDVVLTNNEEGLRVHRIVSAEAPNRIVTRGDAGQENDFGRQEILGRVIEVARNGQQVWQARPSQRYWDASRRLARRLKLAAAVRLKKFGSTIVLLGLALVSGILFNAAPANAQTADLAVTADTPTPALYVAPGSQISYSVTIINNGPNTAAAPSVSMAMPPNTTFVSATKSGGTGTWNCGALAVGATGTETCTKTSGLASAATTTFTFVVQVNAGTANGTVITNTVNISSTTADPNNANNSMSASVTVTTGADLAVTSDTPAPNPVAPGGTITYTVVVGNNGANAATTPSVAMATPANTTFVSAAQTAGNGTWNCTGVTPGSTGTVTCTDTSNFAAGNTATFSIVVGVNTGTAGNTTITNSVTVSSTTGDPNAANNTATASVTVNAADLALTQSASPTVVQAGSTITYTLTLTNNGANAATNAVVYQQTPPNTTFGSVTITPDAGGNWTCNTPATTGQILCSDANNFPSGAVASFSIVVNVNAGTASGTVILNSADTTSSTADPNPNNNASTSSVLVENAADADLAVSMTASPTPVFVSSNLTYTMLVQNLGLSNAANGQLVDTLPAGTTASGFTTTQGSCSGTTTVTCTFGTVNNGATITVTVSLTTPTSPGALTNSATVSTTTTDPVASNNTASVITVVQPLVCASPGKDGAGGTITGIVNAYYPPKNAGTLAAASTSVVLAAAAAGGAQTAIASGDLLLIIQM